MTAQAPQASSRRGWEAIVDLALNEDIGTGDITTLATVPDTAQAQGTILAKDAGVISGIDVARFVFTRVDASIGFEALVSDGDAVEAMTPLARVSGWARSLLTAERTADVILLDNMSDRLISEAVTRRDAADPRILLEASGGITLQRIRRLAATRVDLISCGALTHSAPALDISLDLDIQRQGLPRTGSGDI